MTEREERLRQALQDAKEIMEEWANFAETPDAVKREQIRATARAFVRGVEKLVKKLESHTLPPEPPVEPDPPRPGNPGGGQP